MKKNKVLIIAYSMIPHASTWGGCQRMYYLAEHLVGNGYEVSVISCDSGINDFFGKEIHFKSIALGVKNKFCKTYLASKSVGNEKNVNTTNSHVKKTNSIKSVVKNLKFITSAMSLADRLIYNEPGIITGYVSSRWCKENSDNIISYIKENDIDKIIVTAPPFGMFNIIKHIRKKCPDKKIISDYRDPWNLWKKGSFLTTARERKILKISDKVSCTNQYIIDAFVKKFSIDKNKFLVVANGFNEGDWDGKTVANKKSDLDSFVITYTGAINLNGGGYRDCTNLLNAVIKMNGEGKKVKLRLVGIKLNNSERERTFTKQLGDKLFLSPMVDNSKAIDYILDSDMALIVHTAKDGSGRYIISGKVYDYMRCGIPVLSIGDSQSAHAKLLNDLEIGVNCTDDEADIYKTLTRLYTLWDNAALDEVYNYKKVSNISDYSREAQYKKMEKLIESL